MNLNSMHNISEATSEINQILIVNGGACNIELSMRLPVTAILSYGSIQVDNLLIQGDFFIIFAVHALGPSGIR